MMEHSYHDRTGTDPEQGAAIAVRAAHDGVSLELGERRPVGALSVDAWAALEPAEARQLAGDLNRAADEVERRRSKDAAK